MALDPTVRLVDRAAAGQGLVMWAKFLKFLRQHMKIHATLLAIEDILRAGALAVMACRIISGRAAMCIMAAAVVVARTKICTLHLLDAGTLT